jgi:hypothetical protein
VSDPWGQPQQPQQGGEWSTPPQDSGQPGAFTPPPADGTGQAPQFGVPPQPQYGAAPAYGYPVAPQRNSNGLAIAGFVLAFLGPLALIGLILSIVGLIKSKAAGGKGKGLAIAGIVISIIASVSLGLLVFAASKATALDPGCTTAELKITSLNSKLTTDASNPDALITDLQTVHQDLVDAESKAVHDSVKTKIQAFDTDVQNFISDFQAVKSGSSTDTAKLSADASALSTDGTAVDTTCSSF